MEIVYKDSYVEIFKKASKYYLRTDSGGMVSWLIEFEITKEDVEKIQANPEETYQVLLKYDSKGKRVTE